MSNPQSMKQHDAEKNRVVMVSSFKDSEYVFKGAAGYT